MESTHAFVDPCADGVCKERLCGRVQRDLKSFNFLADEDLHEIAAYLECRQVREGAPLWKEGDNGNFVAFVVQGQLLEEKSTEFPGKQLVLGVYSRGSMVGEHSILEGSVRPASMVAKQHSDLVLLSRNSFEALIKEKPELGIKLLKGMLLASSVRLRKSYERLSSIF